MVYSVELVQVSSPIVIPMEDPILHNAGRPFCSDPQCPCREDQDNLTLLNDLIQRGLLTEQEAELVLKGATI